MFAVLSWLIVGFIVGLFARWITGGRGPRGFLLTSLLGSAGALAGGALARPFHLPQSGVGGFMMSVIGAIVVIAVVSTLSSLGRRRGD